MSAGAPLLGEPVRVQPTNKRGGVYVNALIAVVAFSFGVFFGNVWSPVVRNGYEPMDTAHVLAPIVAAATGNGVGESWQHHNVDFPVNSTAVEKMVVYRQTAPFFGRQ